MEEQQEPVTKDPFALAPASQPKPEPEINYDTAREIRPVVFGHQNQYDLDLRPVESQLEEEVPKDSLAPAYAGTQSSVIGLEDLSATNPETNVPETAEKVTTQTKDQLETGLSTSSKVDSIGKSEPPVVT